MTREQQKEATIAELFDVRNWWSETRTALAREEAMASWRRFIWQRNFQNDD